MQDGREIPGSLLPKSLTPSRQRFFPTFYFSTTGDREGLSGPDCSCCQSRAPCSAPLQPSSCANTSIIWQRKSRASTTIGGTDKSDALSHTYARDQLCRTAASPRLNKNRRGKSCASGQRNVSDLSIQRRCRQAVLWANSTHRFSLAEKLLMRDEVWRIAVNTVTLRQLLRKRPNAQVLPGFLLACMDAFVHTRSLTEDAMRAPVIHTPIFARLRGKGRRRSVQEAESNGD